MPNNGIRVAGIRDIHDAPHQLSYSSDAQSPKVTKPFRGFMMLNSRGFGTVPLQHGLGYRPVAFAFYRLSDGKWRTVNNTSVGVETDLFDFTIRTYDYGGDTPPAELVGTRLDYKVWLLLDPAQEISR